MNIDLITKILAGEAGDDEIKNLKAWIQKNPNNKNEFNQISGLWKNISLSKAYNFNYVISSYRKLENKINDKKYNKVKLFRLYQKIAVALIVFVAITIVFFKISHISASYFTEGNKLEVKLPDNSTVVLNKNSELKYKHNLFGNRKIQFSGEAFFKVKHNMNKPFIICTGQTEITVLGTSFYITAYKTSEKTDIKVTSGTVKVINKMSNNKKIILKQGECVEINIYNNKVSKYIGYDVNTMAWNTGKLVFKSTKLKDVFTALGNTYNLDIRINDPKIEQLTFTGTFNQTEISDILETISKTFDLEMKKDMNKRKIVFY